MGPKFWRQYRFRALETPGFELVEIAEGSRHIDIRGMIVSEADSVAFGASYHIRVGADWTFKGLNLQLLDGRRLKLRSDGQGKWTENDGAPRPDLEDCIDIDLSGSPITNTLPIRRTRLAAGAPETFTMAYVDMPSLDVSPHDQSYEKRGDGLYRYRSVDSGFAADLTVDDEGVVVSYPGLFERVEN